jgi:Na+-transporting methylmalonyl-CoA/oxaloacetate decarboxylase gamma subunit
MSSADLTYTRPRAKRAEQAKAAKAKKQKLLLAGMGVVFVLLLVIQVPRTMRALSPAEPAVAPPPVAVPAPAPAEVLPAPPASPQARAQLDRIQRLYTAKDPFTRRPISGPSGSVGVRAAPAGARDPFASRVSGAPKQAVAVVEVPGVRDPFSPRAVEAPAPPPAPPAPPPVKEPLPVTAPARGYTIILASIPVRNGRGAAQQVAAAARARGVGNVGVVRSSDYSTLRPGYFAVHSQLFETRAEAQRAIGRARALGYPNAYVRPLGR